MIPCATRRYWRSNDPFCSERVIVHYQWGRKPLPADRRCRLSSTGQRRSEPRTWQYGQKFGKERACGSGDILSDRQTYMQTHRQTQSSQYFATALTGEVKMFKHRYRTAISYSQQLDCITLVGLFDIQRSELSQQTG